MDIRKKILFESNTNNDVLRNKISKVEDEKKGLEEYIESVGECMVDVTKGKTYLVQYLKGLSELVGTGYAMCAPLRSDGTYGAFYVKPYSSFRKKEAIPNYQSKAPTRRMPNLYQRMRDGGMYQ